MEIPFEIKRMDEEKGTFVAYGSTFGNEDLGGDIVVKGAFTKSLEQNPAESVFMFFNHDSKEIIGEYTSIKEDEHGLLIEGKLFIDDIVRAKETHFLMKIGKIKKFSIGFQTIKKAMSRGRRMLQELKLIEISPVVFPMNTQADLLGVKNMDLKNQALVSALNSAIEDMVDDGTSRQDIVSQMASAAGISVSTVNQILNNTIDMPPERRLRGFARTLDLELEELVKITEGDKKSIHHIEQLSSLSDGESLLRDNGFSKNAATAFVAFIKKLSDGSESQKRRDKGDGSESQNLDLDEEEELDEDGNPLKPKKDKDKEKDLLLPDKKELEARKQEEKAVGSALDNLIDNLRETKK